MGHRKKEEGEMNELLSMFKRAQLYTLGGMTINNLRDATIGVRIEEIEPHVTEVLTLLTKRGFTRKQTMKLALVLVMAQLAHALNAAGPEFSEKDLENILESPVAPISMEDDAPL